MLTLFNCFLQADFADDEMKSELFAIRFSNAENAKKFKAKFEEAVKVSATVFTITNFLIYFVSFIFLGYFVLEHDAGRVEYRHFRILEYETPPL